MVLLLKSDCVQPMAFSTFVPSVAKQMGGGGQGWGATLGSTFTGHRGGNFARKCISTTPNRERNVLFNDALNTFYLRLYGVRHMVKDHSDSEKENLLAVTYRLTARVLLYAPSHRQYNIPQPLLHQSWSTGWKEK